MDFEPALEDRTVFLTIQNSKKPDQVITFVLVKSKDRFETEGLKTLFGVQEVCVEPRDVFQSPEEYAEVLSFLLETMSAAQDLRLPYAYQSEFDFHGARYSVLDQGDCRKIKRIG